jgi:hypothetical protein
VLFQYLLCVSREPVDVIGNFFGKIFFLTMGIKLTLASQTKKRMGECVSAGWRNTARKKRGRKEEIEKRSR